MVLIQERVEGMRSHVSALLREESLTGFQDKEQFTFVIIFDLI